MGLARRAKEVTAVWRVIFVTGLAAFLVCRAPLSLTNRAQERKNERSHAAKASPLEPHEEAQTFRLLPGLRIELVACEPQVIDPVAMTFDEAGRLYVVEMPSYPNGGIGEGTPAIAGRVKVLADRDGDGFFETASTFADDLRFPTGITPWRDGVFVANAPDLLYLRDTDGDGRADERRVVYTGFGTYNIQQLLNALQFHLDNWIHGCNGINGGIVKPGPGLQFEPLPLLGRHIRFRPDDWSRIEATSGGGQYGMACDDWGNWFTCTNSQHLRHIVVPDRYLKRHPGLAPTGVVRDIPDGVDEHIAAARVFRISPFEAWRLERTERRARDPDLSRRLSPTELVPGGYITSACGVLVYNGGLLGSQYEGDTLVCDPANNLVHRDRLVADGVSFLARRVDRGCEFLASTDTWFRPVFLCLGPEGAVYIADFYREVIETPLSLPEDIQKRYNLQSRGRGRIWRVVPASGAPRRGAPLKQRSELDWVASLESVNSWERLTAQRLLVERGTVSPEALEKLRQKATSAERPQGRLHALWTLEGLRRLDPTLIRRALSDPCPRIREHALKLAEPLLDKDADLLAAALRLQDDEDLRVRFQLAFTLGESNSPLATRGLAYLAARDGQDGYLQTAILSSCRGREALLLSHLQHHKHLPPAFARALGMLLARGDARQTAQSVAAWLREDRLLEPPVKDVLAGIADGLATRGLSLSQLLVQHAGASKWQAFVADCASHLENEQLPVPQRSERARFLAHMPYTMVEQLAPRMLAPSTPAELQLACIRALAYRREPGVAGLLLRFWAGYTPAARQEVIEALFLRSDRLPMLVEALERGQIAASQLPAARRVQLQTLTDPSLRARAAAALAKLVEADRQRVVKQYEQALHASGDIQRGRAVFQKHCQTCHRLAGEGKDVGPDLAAALRTKLPETLLSDLFDPSHEVDPRYVNYVVVTRDGRVLSGIIAQDSANSILLRRAEQAEDQVLRQDIEEIQSTAKSLMPEGLEKELTVRDVADLAAYLFSVVGRRWPQRP
ncbi:MAG: dehydrogenase [Gemmataceae bacterium]